MSEIYYRFNYWDFKELKGSQDVGIASSSVKILYKSHTKGMGRHFEVISSEVEIPITEGIKKVDSGNIGEILQKFVKKGALIGDIFYCESSTDTFYFNGRNNWKVNLLKKFGVSKFETGFFFENPPISKNGKQSITNYNGGIIVTPDTQVLVNPYPKTDYDNVRRYGYKHFITFDPSKKGEQQLTKEELDAYPSTSLPPIIIRKKGISGGVYWKELGTDIQYPCNITPKFFIGKKYRNGEITVKTIGEIESKKCGEKYETSLTLNSFNVNDEVIISLMPKELKTFYERCVKYFNLDNDVYCETLSGEIINNKRMFYFII